MTAATSIWTDERILRLKELWRDDSIRAEDVARALGVSLSSLKGFLKKHRNVVGLEQRPSGGERARKYGKTVATPPAPRAARQAAPSALLESSIPWPDKSRLMAGR